MLGVKEFSRGEVEKKKKEKTKLRFRISQKLNPTQCTYRCLAWVTTTYNSNLNEKMYIYIWLTKFSKVQNGVIIYIYIYEKSKGYQWEVLSCNKKWW